MGVAVLLSSAYVLVGGPKAYAVSTSVLITQIQAGGVGAATQEFVVLYNNSDNKVNISGWCLSNKANVLFACFGPAGIGKETYIPARKHVVIASNTLSYLQPTGAVGLTYTPASQSSGSMTGSSDTITLVDNLGTVVDRYSWSVPIAAGMQFERHGSGVPIIYVDTDTGADWSVTVPGVLPLDESEVDTTVVDVCPNIDGVQIDVPAGNILDRTGNCVKKQIAQLAITEILPNAMGSDVGQEFVELFNPNDFTVELKDYMLYVGPNFEDRYSFPNGATIQPKGYMGYTNAVIPFTLLNTSSRVALAPSDDDQVINEVTAYVDPPDGQSWALINNEWQYTKQPTPGSANMVTSDSTPDSVVFSGLQPCAANQYRSPDTNRCRLLTVMPGSVTPCKNGQYRSEETNRCRNIATDAKVTTPCNEGEERNLETNRCRKIVVASTPAPCREGQERNPDTNRCRTITKMPSAEYGVLGAETKNSGNLYVWAAIGGVLLLALGYAIWEWHDEIGKFSQKQYHRLLRFARRDK